jgi:hypothetical protein
MNEWMGSARLTNERPTETGLGHQTTQLLTVRFQVVTEAASMKMTVFWDDDDDGGSKHLWNVSQLLQDYTAQHPRTQSSRTLDSLISIVLIATEHVPGGWSMLGLHNEKLQNVHASPKISVS